MSEWGNPARVIPRYFRKEEPTRGTETSNYPEEEKSNEIPRVAASESGRAQTVAVQTAAGLRGLVDGDRKRSGTRLERRTGEGESPVCETRVES
jgi:hypothetical protein